MISEGIHWETSSQKLMGFRAHLQNLQKQIGAYLCISTPHFICATSTRLLKVFPMHKYQKQRLLTMPIVGSKTNSVRTKFTVARIIDNSSNLPYYSRESIQARFCTDWIGGKHEHSGHQF